MHTAVYKINLITTKMPVTNSNIYGHYYKKFIEISAASNKKSGEYATRLAFLFFPLLYINLNSVPNHLIKYSIQKGCDRIYRKTNAESIINNPKIYFITEYIPITNNFFAAYELFNNFTIVQNNHHILLLCSYEGSILEALFYYRTKNTLDLRVDILVDNICSEVKKEWDNDIKYLTQAIDMSSTIKMISTTESKYDLIIEYVYCNQQGKLSNLIRSLTNLKKSGTLVFFIQNVVSKFNADIVIILQSLFDTIELYNPEIDATNNGSYCICFGYKPNEKIIDDLNSIVVDGYIDSLIDVDDVAYDFIREFNDQVYVTAPKKYMKMYAFSYIFYGAFYTLYRNFCFAKTPRKYRKCMHFHIFSRAVYIYLKEIYLLLFKSKHEVIQILDKKLPVNFVKSVAYAKKYDFTIRIYMKSLTDSKLGIMFMKDLYYKHRPINYAFDKIQDNKMVTIPPFFKKSEGKIIIAHMIIDTRFIDDWMFKKNILRYYRPRNKRNTLISIVEENYNTGKISQAWLKMYEILTQIKLIDCGNNIKTFHICEAPGNFISAINHYAKTVLGVKFEWKAQSLATDIVGVGFGDDYGYIKKYRSNWDFGADGTGDITKIDNIVYYRDMIGDMDVDLITSDCGLSLGECGAIGNMTKIHYSAFVAILMCLPRGKNFVAKYFMPIVKPIEFCILYILYKHFDKLIFYKPVVNVFSKEFYICGIGYKGMIDEMIQVLLDKVHNYDENFSLYKSYPRSFINQLVVVSNEIMDNYLINFRRQIYFVDNYNFIDTEMKTMYYNYILQKNDEWLEMTKIKRIKTIDKF